LAGAPNAIASATVDIVDLSLSYVLSGLTGIRNRFAAERSSLERSTGLVVDGDRAAVGHSRDRRSASKWQRLRLANGEPDILAGGIGRLARPPLGVSCCDSLSEKRSFQFAWFVSGVRARIGSSASSIH
jgi:hypothetical protein